MSTDSNDQAGEPTSDYVVEEMLGESEVASVFTTQDNQLRWVYKANNGKPITEHGAIILYFDQLMHQIRILNLPKESKRPLYILLGKTLFSGLNNHVEGTPKEVFLSFERELETHSEIDHTNAEKFDIVIICALSNIELSAVMSLSIWTRLPPCEEDPQTYYCSEWVSNEGKTLNVVAAAPNHMGVTCSGVLAAKMILKFKPKVVAMPGIAAGVKSDKQEFGDIIIPDQTFDYGAGKVVEQDGNSKILPSTNPLSINARALGLFKEWQRERTDLDLIVKGWPADRPTSPLNIHIGPMFSSPLVLDSQKSVDSLLSSARKLAGIEMESHAVHRACNDTIEPQPIFVCLKSICDFAQDKQDDWQPYAAYTSSRLLRAFVLKEWSALIIDVQK